MKKSNVLWGLFLVIIGLTFALNALDISDINLFFDGWWTFIIIIPCFLGLFREKEKLGNIIGILIGLALLLAVQNVISFNIIMKMIFPLIIIIIGTSLIFKDRVYKKVKNKISDQNKSNINEYYATFATQNLKFKDKDLENIELNAVFGTMKCDLNGANIKNDKIIKVYAIFGSVKLNVPNDYDIVLNSVPIFGSVTNNVKKVKDDDAKTIYIEAVSIFGGVKII